jgi:hypothetical protein
MEQNSYQFVYMVMIKLSLYLAKYHAMKTYEGVSKSFRTGRLGARTANGTALCH